MIRVKEMLLQYALWENSLYGIVIAIGIFVGVLILLKVFQLVIMNRLKAWCKRTETKIDDTLLGIVESINTFTYVITALYIAIGSLQLHWLIYKIILFVFLFMLVYEIAKAAGRLSAYGVKRYVERQHQTKDEGEIHVKNLARIAATVAKVLVWSVGLLFILSNIGINVTSLVASLGIGGIAIAFALQQILGDMFNSFSIYFDRPFEVGDFIVVGDKNGIVKKIGLKSTRLQTLLGEELIISNNDITAARVQNFKRMQKRREVMVFGVVYETPAEKLEEIPVIVKEIISSVEHAELDRCHFSSYGDFSLNFETVYFIDSPDYNLYMDVKQRVNLELFKRFEREGIEFAYPTQKVFVGRG